MPEIEGEFRGDDRLLDSAVSYLRWCSGNGEGSESDPISHDKHLCMPYIAEMGFS